MKFSCLNQQGFQINHKQNRGSQGAQKGNAMIPKDRFQFQRRSSPTETVVPEGLHHHIHVKGPEWVQAFPLLLREFYSKHPEGQLYSWNKHLISHEESYFCTKWEDERGVRIRLIEVCILTDPGSSICSKLCIHNFNFLYLFIEIMISSIHIGATFSGQHTNNLEIKFSNRWSMQKCYLLCFIHHVIFNL